MEAASASAAEEAEMATADAAFAQRGCCCFWISWPSSSSRGRKSWERIHTVAGPAPASPGGWWRRGLKVLMKVREWSEIVAGPRWKTFIRRFGRGGSRQGGGGGGSVGAGRGRKFQYDPLSYSLNFDEGDSEGESVGFRDFSARFAAPPMSTRSSMDLGGRDGPQLFASPPNGSGGGSN